MNNSTLRSELSYEPAVLKFGTSGRRGLVRDLTHLEIYVNVLGELRFLQSLSPEAGGTAPGDEFYFASDLRPSSASLAQAVQRAATDAGMRTVNLGTIPTPALAYYALSRQRAAIMITGSHIPFDRNGYKLYTSRGELLKTDEAPINASVEQVRSELYGQPFAQSVFDASGMFREPVEVAPPVEDARTAYVRRYVDFFNWLDLRGRRIVVYEHSAVGRDILKQIVTQLGAEVIAVGRSETFVPVDTENIEQEQLDGITALVRQAVGEGGSVDVILSTDGDSDRPLLLAWDAGQGKAVFYPGDLLGMVTAMSIDADAVVVPITCNDGIDRGSLGGVLETKTRVGSPYVIQGMNHARAKGCSRVCAWEANGGFLLGSDVERHGRVLTALATRDAMLPLISVVSVAVERNMPVSAVFAELPARYTSSRLLREFSRAVSNRILERFAPGNSAIRRLKFAGSEVEPHDAEGTDVILSEVEQDRLLAIRSDIEGIFSTAAGFGNLVGLDYTDGLRMYFENGDVAHVRPSGNAEELRIYAASGTVARAAEICALGVKEPGGLLRQLEALVS